MKQFVSIVAMVFAVLVIGGCGASSGDPATTQSQPAQEANPAGAIEKIYETIEMRGLVDAQDEDVTDRFQMNLENIESYNIRYSLGRFGVADTFIIKPAEGKESDVWDDLAAVKNARIEEFEKYDILGAYEISKDAEIYTRGDYVIMVMHQDNDAAKKLLRNTSPHRGSALPRRRGCFCFISTGVCGCGIGKTKIQWFQRNIEIQCASQAQEEIECTKMR